MQRMFDGQIFGIVATPRYLLNFIDFSMKIYTKTGDLGETGLFGGRRLPKNHARIEAYGTVDELNSFIGLLHDSLDSVHEKSVLRVIQDRLFTVGSHLACDPEQMPLLPDLNENDLIFLENEIDAMDSGLPPLKNFVLPGGHPAVSVAHVCRTVCRRAERRVVERRAAGRSRPSRTRGSRCAGAAWATGCTG